MSTNQHTLRTRLTLLAFLLAGGLLSAHSALGAVQPAKPMQAAATQEPTALKLAAADSQGKVSPYAKANRQRQGDSGAKAPTPGNRAARKGGR
jgi:hypothetical protein